MDLQQHTSAKLVLLGEMGSGKSSLVLRYVKGTYFDDLVGVRVVREHAHKAERLWVCQTHVRPPSLSTHTKHTPHTLTNTHPSPANAMIMSGLPCRCNSRTQFLAREKDSGLVMSYTMMAALAPLHTKHKSNRIADGLTIERSIGC